MKLQYVLEGIEEAGEDLATIKELYQNSGADLQKVKSYVERKITLLEAFCLCLEHINQAQTPDGEKGRTNG